MFWPYGKYEVLLHKLNLDWLVRQVKKNTDDIEDIREHGGGGVTPDISATATVDNNVGTPSVAVVKTGTDEAPNFAFNFHNLKGATGAAGSDGRDGVDGRNGSDGVSPEVTITSITGGHTVKITDADHPSGQSFNVMDGVDGVDGTNGSDGAPGARGGDFWRTTVTPTYSSGRYRVGISNLYGVAGDTPRVGDIIFNSYYYYIITDLDATYAYAATRTSIQGPQGNQGNPGQGVPAGGTAGQVLSKIDGTDYNCQWVNAGGGGGSVPSYIFTPNSSSSDANDIMASLSANRIPPFVDNGHVYTNAYIEDLNLMQVSGGSYTNLGDLLLNMNGTMRIGYHDYSGSLQHTVEIAYNFGITDVYLN